MDKKKGGQNIKIVITEKQKAQRYPIYKKSFFSLSLVPRVPLEGKRVYRRKQFEGQLQRDIYRRREFLLNVSFLINQNWQMSYK